MGEGTVRLAVFDFDGTCLKGNSTVMLSRDLLKEGYITKGCALRLILWGVQYVLHLPRERGGAFYDMFTAFRGWSVWDIDEYLADLYARVIRPRLRPGAKAAIAQARADGCVTILLSATFSNLVRLAKDDLGVDFVVATPMFRDVDGSYTGLTDGEIEGERKVEELAAFADERFGKGAWTLERAYADHVSDRPILGAAEHAAVVSPSPLLRIAAVFRGWPVLSW